MRTLLLPTRTKQAGSKQQIPNHRISMYPASSSTTTSLTHRTMRYAPRTTRHTQRNSHIGSIFRGCLNGVPSSTVVRPRWHFEAKHNRPCSEIIIYLNLITLITRQVVLKIERQSSVDRPPPAVSALSLNSHFLSLTNYDPYGSGIPIRTLSEFQGTINNFALINTVVCDAQSVQTFLTHRS